MDRTQVYLYKSQSQEIALIAKRHKKAKAEVIRDLIQRGIEANKNRETIGQALQKLISLKVAGPADLSTNIDKYLYDEA